MKKIPVILWLVLLSVACQSLPKERYTQFYVQTKLEVEEDSVRLIFPNSLDCPLQVTIHHSDPDIDAIIGTASPEVIEARQTREFAWLVPNWEDDWRNGLLLHTTFGAPSHFSDEPIVYGLPFPKGREYKILQGYNGSFSHQEEFSRYAIDFALQPGDTICAMYDGVVIGVIEGYDVGGPKPKYRPFGNFISLYHEHGAVSQYAHLLHQGVLVNIGDSVKTGQPIALSGETGFTSGPHVHVNVLKPLVGKMVSMPVTFTIGPGDSLRRGMIARHPAPLD